MDNIQLDLPTFSVKLMQEPVALLGKALDVATDATVASAVTVKILSVPAGGVREAPLIVAFHGYVDQSKRTLPVFDGTQYLPVVGGKAVVLSIFDSALQLDPSISVGWFLGTAQVDLPAAIRAMVDHLVERLSPSRLVFVAGSTGAHAALHHSAQYPDSICIVANPLTKVTDFHADKVSAYLRHAWPGRKSEAVFDGLRVNDAAAAYSRGYGNKVVVLQNCTDHYFFGPISRTLGHLGAGLTQQPLSAMVVSEFFPTHIGHTYPAAPLLRWVSAAAFSSGPSLIDIARGAAPAAVAYSASPAPAGGAKANQRDLQIASML
ncbi:MAG: hypothetical protein IV094_06585 [Vitreoscilla sp.]|nr:hypothetical protein [Vitreoscilla sp.]